MTTDELVIEVKKGLGISTDPNEKIDPVIKQKVLSVKAFLKNAGVTDENMNGELAIGVIVMGVNDLWDSEAGEIKFSPAFFTLVTQLASG